MPQLTFYVILQSSMHKLEIIVLNMYNRIYTHAVEDDVSYI